MQNIKKQICSLIEKALKKGDFQNYPHYKAKSYRILGEIAELEGDIKNAVKFCEFAIKFDPKVGVKRKLNMLRKK